MMPGFMKNLIERIKDPSRSFKERVFILLTIVTDFGVIMALIGDIIFGENIVEIIVLSITVVIVPIIMIVSVKLDKVALAVRLIVIGLVFIILPVAFYFGGGLEGGSVLWIVFAYLYTGLVLSGKWKPVMLVILTTEAIGFHLNAYYNNKFIHIHSRELYVIDSFISIVLVGVVCCMMVWFEEWLFNEENKRAREETAKIEEMVKAQNRFFSSMSHEIRTPINSILGLNEIILRQEDASEEIKRDAGNIQGAGRMLLALVNDILDISKIEAGKLDIIPVNYELREMVSELVSMMWLRAEEKGLDFKVEIDPTLPVELFGDEVRIKQILVNLLNNAIKYTSSGTVTLHIEKEEISGDGILLLYSVTDTGMGIKPDAIPYLFDAFTRVDEQKNAKIEGTGLGLSIVKRLVNLMGGRISVNSVYTEGSTFTVRLWQRVTRADAIGNINITNYGSGRAMDKYEPGFTAPDAKILIVDDNEMNLEVEEKLLLGTQITIDTASSGEEALSMTLKKHYDIILMDHLMPEMDGIECMQLIRKQSGGLNNHAPIIVLTANAGSENIELYSRSGFDGYLVKPVSGKQLEDMVVSHLPEAKVIRTEGADLAKVQMNTAKGYNRKIPVVVATSSMCDLPHKVLSDLQIDMIPFHIFMEGRAYYDGIEASTDEVTHYMKAGAEFDSSPPSVEEFERFFGDEIRKAHQVIYISLPPEISGEYYNAKKAATIYENVEVFNSENNSSAMGMLVLLAYRMAMQGRRPEKILKELNVLKEKVSCTFVTGDAAFMMKRGIIGRGIYNFMNVFSLRPGLRVQNGGLKVGGMYVGELKRCYEKYVDFALPKHAKPDLDVIFVDYVELSDDERSAIENRIRRRFNFENIIFQKVSAVMSLNCGMGAIGLAYIMKSDRDYSFSQMLFDVDESSGEAVYDIPDENVREDAVQDVIPEEEPRWYDGLDGIDAQAGINGSGSEEVYKTVLKMFYQTIEAKSDEIEGFYKSEDWHNYVIKVHALKSSARIIGAKQLAEDAAHLETAGKEENVQYIMDNTDKLLADYRGYKAILMKVFE